MANPKTHATTTSPPTRRKRALPAAAEPTVAAKPSTHTRTSPLGRKQALNGHQDDDLNLNHDHDHSHDDVNHDDDGNAHVHANGQAAAAAAAAAQPAKKLKTAKGAESPPHQQLHQNGHVGNVKSRDIHRGDERRLQGQGQGQTKGNVVEKEPNKDIINHHDGAALGGRKRRHEADHEGENGHVGEDEKGNEEEEENHNELRRTARKSKESALAAFSTAAAATTNGHHHHDGGDNNYVATDDGDDEAAASDDDDDEMDAKRKRAAKAKGKVKEHVRRKSKSAAMDEVESNGQDGDGDEGEEEYEGNQDDDADMESLNLNIPAIGKTEAQAGVIEEVELVNFMCHKYFKIQLLPNLNFLTGPNGSGKSAVLTAISVCLGGKAGITNRASSLKSFVKSGANACQVTLKLRNRGEEAFRAADYGHTITIERKIVADGTGGYQLKSHKGTVVSRQKEDLSAILDHFNIQVENPLVILNQDVAREFLTSKDDSEKYRFFMKGTLLEQTSQDYAFIREQEGVIKATLETKKRDLEEMRDTVKALAAKVKEYKQLDELQETMTGLQKMMAWAQVEEKEKELARQEAELEKAKKKVLPIVQQLQETDARIADIAQTLAEIADKVKELEASKEENKAPMREVQEDLKKLQAELKEAVNEAQDAEKQAKELKKEAGRLQQKIDEEKKALEAFTKEKKDAQLATVARLEREVQGIEEDSASAKEEKERTEAELQKAKEDAEEWSSRFSEAKANLGRLQDHLKDLRAQKENHLKTFGESIPEVLQAIEQHRGKFHFRVVGPVGKHVRLRDKAWSFAMNGIIGNLLPNFIVQDFHDANVLKEIFKRHGCTNAIVVRRGFDCPDVRGHLPDAKYTRVLDVLDIDEECVRAHLIDSRGVERIILIPTYNEASRVIYQDRPRNVESAYTHEAEQVLYRGGARLFYGITGRADKARFFDDIGQQIRDTEHRLETATDAVKRMEAEKRGLQEPARALERQLEAARRRLGALQGDLGRRRRELAEARDLLEQEKPSNLGVLEAEKARVEEELDMMKSQYNALVEQVRKVNGRREPLQKQLKAHEAAHREVETRVQHLQGEADKLLGQKGTLESHRVHYEKVRTETLARIGEHEKVVEGTRLAVHGMVTQAEKVSVERVEVTKTPKVLDAELKRLERSIHLKEQEFGDREAVERDYNAKAEEYKNIRKAIDNSRKLLQRIDTALKDRVVKWYEYRSFIALRARMLFIQSLTHRGYSGKLKFDHDDAKLKILVETKDSKGRKDTKQLSGGERSFSTVCFLLSLWETTECPFRALDEYDVFMDAVNRRISTKMIIEVARISKDRQFILISPQDMSNIELTPDVNVVRLDPPERGEVRS